MSTLQLESWLSRLKDFSVNELILAEEIIQQELKSRAKNIGAADSPNTSEHPPSSVLAAQITEANLPPELRHELAGIVSLDDKALWKVARRHIPAQSLKKLNQLNYKQQSEGKNNLSQEEIRELNDLRYQHGRYLLLRAEAAVLLKKRGQDISSLRPK